MSDDDYQLIASRDIEDLQKNILWVLINSIHLYAAADEIVKCYYTFKLDGYTDFNLSSSAKPCMYIYVLLKHDENILHVFIKTAYHMLVFMYFLHPSTCVLNQC